ncbi:MAG: hypothetical protein WBQ18_07125 [Solirubrobacteraceae bacterium]
MRWGALRAARLRTARTAVAVLTAAALAVGGCGSGTMLLHAGETQSAIKVAPGVPAAAVAVIRGWSDALRAGRVVAAAHYFRVPSVFFTGNGPPIELQSGVDVLHANAALPCGARLLAVQLRGRYVNALFRLTNRPGPGGTGGCGSGTGQTARTDFLIRRGRIVQWLRAPDQPGDNGSPPGTGTGSTPLI